MALEAAYSLFDMVSGQLLLVIVRGKECEPVFIIWSKEILASDSK